MSTPQTLTAEHTDADEDSQVPPSVALARLIAAEPEGRRMNGAGLGNRVLFTFCTPDFKDPTTEAFRAKLKGGKAKAGQ